MFESAEENTYCGRHKERDAIIQWIRERVKLKFKFIDLVHQKSGSASLLLDGALRKRSGHVCMRHCKRNDNNCFSSECTWWRCERVLKCSRVLHVNFAFTSWFSFVSTGAILTHLKDVSKFVPSLLGFTFMYASSQVISVNSIHFGSNRSDNWITSTLRTFLRISARSQILLLVGFLRTRTSSLIFYVNLHWLTEWRLPITQHMSIY